MFEQTRWRLNRVKTSIFFTTISIATFIFLVLIMTDNIPLVSYSSLDHFVPKPENRLISSFQNRSFVIRHEALNSVGEPLVIVDEVAQVEEGSDRSDSTVLVPPFNLRKRERIFWFKSKLPEFDILKSTSRTRQFERRVEEFFGSGECSVQFFMTWISPARCFGRREFLALDSLFKTNPKGCLMILSNSLDSAHGLRILKPLLDCGFRVGSVSPDLGLLFKGTPVEPWFELVKRGETDPGEIPLHQNLSNLVRLVILYKYGGVYVDTDFITLKDFKGLRNSIGAQSINAFGKWTRLNNAVLVFDKNHPLLYAFMEEFASTFNGNIWGYNGPYLVSRVVDREAIRLGSNFTVLPPIAFYPTDWTRIKDFFKRPINHAHRKWIEAKLVQLRGSSYGIHLWNRQSGRLRIEEESIIGKMISDHCVICNNYV